MKKTKSYYTSIIFASGLFFILFSVIFIRLLSKSYSLNQNNKVSYEKVLSAEDIDNNLSDLPEDFPDDFPIYPNAFVVSTNMVETSEIEAISVILQTKDDYPEVLNFYKEELNVLGWERGGITGFSNSITFSVFKDNIEGYVGITTLSNNHSKISITLGKK